MATQYRQLTLEERDKIHFMLWDKLSVREMARRLGRSPSTISREISRNTPLLKRRYTPHLAQEKYETRKRVARQRPRLKDPTIVAYVRERIIEQQWSPEQIAGRWNREHKSMTISHEAIYQYIYESCKPGSPDDLRPYLKRKHKRRKRKHIMFKDEGKARIVGKISIEQRPKYIEKRRQMGHWEGDSVESHRGSKAALNTLVERKSKLVKITKLHKKNSQTTADAVVKKLGPYSEEQRRTLTLDNGTENAKHAQITQMIGIQCYFAHPYHSWERGTNENTNGLIRHYFPKGTDFANVTEQEIQRVEDLLNNRPRKSLNYMTPLEVFTRACCT